MRTLIVTEFITLDGIIDSPGGGEHPHGGWTFKDVTFDEAAYELKGREQQQAGALLVGRKTWEDFEGIWPTMTEEFGRYNAMPKYVVSTTLDEPRVAASGWQPMTLLRSIDQVRALKEDDSAGTDPIIVHGSATLAQSLAKADLVDRYHLLVFPVLLGSGKRLFPTDGDKRNLHLVESHTYDNGITMMVLDVTRSPAA